MTKQLYRNNANTLATFICLIGLMSFSSTVVRAEDAPAAPPAMPVTVANPEVRVMAEFDEYTGRFEAFQEVDIRARVSGYLEKIHFQDGQLVEVGDPLFSIDPRPYQAAVDVAQAEVSRAESQRGLAAQEVTRARRLVNKKAMSQEELDSRSAALKTAQANIAAAQAALTNAKLDLEYTEITSPISGRISDRKIDIGNLIQTGGLQVLTTIVSHEPVYFVFDVSEGDYLKYQRRLMGKGTSEMLDASQEIKVRLLDEEEFLHIGKLNFIDTRLDQGTSTIRLRALFDDNAKGLLLPGIFGRVRVPVGEPQNTLLVPDKAIMADMASKIVMTVDADNKVVPKPVQLGGLHDGMRVITEGITAEDRIVVEGLLRARPGATVAPHTAEEANATAGNGE